jgi:hypothetical protein
MTDRAPPVEQIWQAIGRIEELDTQMIEIDERITRYQELIDGPDVDGWDRIDAEGKVLPLMEQRNKLRGQLLEAVGELTGAGCRLIDAWRENLIDDIGRELEQGRGVLARVLDEFPGIGTQAVWNRLYRGAVPF